MTEKEMLEKISQDEILLLINSLLDKWKDVKIKRFIVKDDIQFPPCFISVNLQKLTEICIESENGGLLIDSEEGVRAIKAGFCVTVGVGDINHKKANGLGIGHYTNITSLKKNALRKTISNGIDNAFKLALGEYFNHHSKISEIKNNKEFDKLSKEKPVNYYEDEKKISIDLKSLMETIEEMDSSISQNKKVEKSEIELKIVKQDRWFASFEKIDEAVELRSNIFTSDLNSNIVSRINLRDAEGRLNSYYTSKKIINFLEFNSIINESKEEILKTIDEFYKAPVLESDYYRVVASPEAAYTILHEAFGAHLVSAGLIDEGGATAFKAKLGKKVLPEIITIIDDPTVDNMFGSYKFDEEGQQAKRVVLVENGILKNYLYDRISAGRNNVNANGHGRADFGEVPEPRTANMIVSSTQSFSEKELIEMMIEDLKKNNEPFGLYIDGRAGEVDVESSQFKIFVPKFYKIYPDGKAEPVASGFIVGDAYATLNTIKAIANNQTECVGLCGAESGIIRTGGLCPSIYFERLSILSSIEEPDADSLDDDKN